jgi:hypothetical protein
MPWKGDPEFLGWIKGAVGASLSPPGGCKDRMSLLQGGAGKLGLTQLAELQQGSEEPQ